MYKKVLVPLDRSELAECTLAHVINLAKDGAVGEVVLLHAIQMELPLDDIPSDDIDVGKRFDVQSLWADQRNKAKKYLAAAQLQLSSQGIKVGTEVIEGCKPAQAIIDYSREQGIDLIMLATHGRTGMKGMLMGSVAFRVLHESAVPVLLIRPEACRG